MVDAHHKQIAYNQTHACLRCPFGCMGIAMNNELKEISEAFEVGDTYEFKIEHIDNSNDISLQKVVDLIKEIQTTVNFITYINDIEDSELDQER